MTTIPIDENCSDWTSTERIDSLGDALPGCALYGTADSNDYYMAIKATVSIDPVIGPGTTIWLNTGQNGGTGYSPFDSIGADYNVTFNASGVPYLDTGAAGQKLISATPLTYALSPDGESLEIVYRRSSIDSSKGNPTRLSADGKASDA
ncbi:MAG: hypothetical protein JO212_07840 [Acetobacteraceae bacterium]|nr:hypothetical protein [Acetobacteraceae bacterium]